MKNIYKKRGFSLFELVIYAFLLAVILGIVFRMAIFNRRTFEKPAASFRIQQDLMSIQEQLRRDLEETHLSTVKIFPADPNSTDPPGISMISPRDIVKDEIQTTPSGTPNWQKIIYYYVEKDPDRPETGRLVRREGTIPGLPSANPSASPYKPNEAPHESKRGRIAARHIMLPNDAAKEINLKLGNQGGFEANFMNHNGEKSRTDYQHNHIVVVNLTAKEISKSTGKPTVLGTEIRVCPRH